VVCAANPSRSLGAGPKGRQAQIRKSGEIATVPVLRVTLFDVAGFAAAGSLTLGAVTGSGAVKALAAVAGSLARCTLS
jgi:hypothetical protein